MKVFLSHSRFKVVFSGCSEGVYRGDERMASINPKSTHMFIYDINTYMKKGKHHYCAGGP